MIKTTITTTLLCSLAFLTANAEDGEKGKKGKKRPTPQEVFAKLDADENGSISLDEFELPKMRKKEGAEEGEAKKERPTKEEAFAKIDADSNGSISLEELEAHAESRRDKMAKKGKRGAKSEE